MQRKKVAARGNASVDSVREPEPPRGCLPEGPVSV